VLRLPPDVRRGAGERKAHTPCELRPEERVRYTHFVVGRKLRDSHPKTQGLVVLRDGRS